MGIDIEKKLNDAGYRMLGDSSGIEELILSILKTKDTRYLKAIPFLIYKHKDIFIKIYKSSKDRNIKEIFDIMMKISANIFYELNIIGIFPEESQQSEISNSDIHKIGLSYNEFKDEFELQLRNDQKPNLLIDTQKIDEERNLQFGLSILFTKKEKQIIKRLQNDKPISRTDYEYYSRKTKKKLRSIISLQDFARNTFSKTPKYDEDLFELKKSLEEFLSKKKVNESIEAFHMDDSRIIFNLRNKGGRNSSFIVNLNKIKDKKILTLLKKYNEHDFR